jgi:hypothetical protein
MDNMEHDINSLDKILNSPLFLNKYPFIKKVSVYQFGKHIDIVMHPSDTGQYWLVKDEIYSYIWGIAKMATITSRFNIYP